MATRLEEIALDLLGLPRRSRAVLAHKLLESLDDDESPDAEQLWMAEIQRRCAEVDAGKVEGIPAEEVFRELREQFP